MIEAKNIDTETGLYFLFMTLAAIFGSIKNGFIIPFSSGNSKLLLLDSPSSLLWHRSA